MTMTVKRTEVSKPGTDGLSSFEAFLKWEEASRDTIDVKRCYIDLAGDLVTGILLSQIIYWYLPSKRGESRLRIERDGKHWMAKGRRDWWDECRITPKQFDRSIKILRDKGLVETRLFKFRGTPTLHVWLNGPALVEGVNLILPKGENRYLPKVNNDIDQTVKTSNIDYITEITNIEHFGDEEEEDNHHHAAASVVTFFQKEMKIDGINPAMERELGDLVENFSPDRVKGAISAAALYEVGSPLPYIRTVLENERDRKEKEKESRKNVLGSADNVRLTDNEVLDLVKRFSKGGAEARIEGLSLFKGSSGREYKCDYWTILSWVKRGNQDGTPWDPEPPDSWRISQKWLDERASVAPDPAVRDGKGVFVIGGYTGTRARSRPFRSLVLGLPASDGLKHVGNVGVGFKWNFLPELYDHLQSIRTEESPFEPGTDMKKIEKHGSGVSWVRPTLIAEVKYSDVSQAGMLYQPMFKCLRPDLTAEDARVDYDGGGING